MNSEYFSLVVTDIYSICFEKNLYFCALPIKSCAAEKLMQLRLTKLG